MSDDEIILISFIGFIILLILYFRLRKQIHQLSDQVAQLSSPANQPTAAPSVAKTKNTSVQTSTTPTPIPAQASVLPNPTTPAEPAALKKFIAWIQEDWLLKLGALLLLIGFGWLATYAFIHNWIGPMGRITLGVVAGTLILTLGYWRIRKYVQQGSVFIVLGSTTILLTLFAAREVYGFFTPFTVLAAMFLSTIFVAFASVKYKVRSLAYLSLLLAAVAPFLINSPQSDPVELFSYLLIIILGSIWIVALTQWRGLTLVGLGIFIYYSLPVITRTLPQHDNILLFFAYAFAAIFFITNALGLIKLKKDITPDLIAAAINGLLLLVWIEAKAPKDWQSLIIAAWMIVFAAGAFMVFRLTAKREPFYIYAAISIAMLAAATAAELNGATLIIAYTVETGAIIMATWAILKDRHTTRILCFLLLGPTILALKSFESSTWRRLSYRQETFSLLNEHFFVILILGLTFLGLAIFFIKQLINYSDQTDSRMAWIMFVLGSASIYRLLWLALHNTMISTDTATTICLFIFTSIGLASYLWGQYKSSKEYTWYGGAMLGFVVGRLLLVEVWQMAISGRIIVFFLIGTMLAGTAFIGRSWRKVKSISNQTKT